MKSGRCGERFERESVVSEKQKRNADMGPHGKIAKRKRKKCGADGNDGNCGSAENPKCATVHVTRTAEKAT